jgi:RsiW-degrading membrane proteinase PrsW (M82 family)
MGGLIALSIVPMITVLAYLNAKGGEDEPRANLIRTFQLGLAGMLVGLFVSFPLRLLDTQSVSPFADALLASIVFASIPGECVKLLVLRYYCQRLRMFKSLPAGLIYGGVAALGFMLADHFVFASPQLHFVSPLRALAAVPMHAATGALMGYALAHRMLVRNSRWTIGKGWSLSVLAHSIFNLCWISAGMYRSLDGTSWLILYGLPLFAIAIVIVLGCWMCRKLDRLRSIQLLQAISSTPVESATDPTFLQRLKAADRRDETG